MCLPKSGQQDTEILTFLIKVICLLLVVVACLKISEKVEYLLVPLTDFDDFYMYPPKLELAHPDFISNFS